VKGKLIHLQIIPKRLIVLVAIPFFPTFFLIVILFKWTVGLCVNMPSLDWDFSAAWGYGSGWEKFRSAKIPSNLRDHLGSNWQVNPMEDGHRIVNSAYVAQWNDPCCRSDRPAGFWGPPLQEIHHSNSQRLVTASVQPQNHMGMGQTTWNDNMRGNQQPWAHFLGFDSSPNMTPWKKSVCVSLHQN